MAIETPAPPSVLAADSAAARAKVEELARRGREKLNLFDTEGYEEAVPLFREALETSPSYAPAYEGLSETYAYWGFRREINGQESQSLYDMAHDYAAMALRLAPDDANAHRVMAVALRRGRRADPERRRQEVRLALDLDPGSAKAWAEQWRVNGYHPEEPSLRRALELEPNLLSLHIDLGAVFCELCRYDDAIAELLQALRLNPRNSLALYDLAMVLDRKGARADAIQVLRKALRLRPDEFLLETGLDMLEH